jgi:glucokinase
MIGAPIIIENDANLAGLAEARSLPTVPECCLYITISTGIGTGIIVNGTILPALADSEGGHVLVEYDGHMRTWESFASGRAIRQTYGTYAKDINDPIVWAHIADKISRGLLSIIPMLQPQVIVIGGSIGTFFDNYDNTLTQLLAERLPEHIALPDIVQASHPEHAVLYGCYYHGIDSLSH